MDKDADLLFLHLFSDLLLFPQVEDVGGVEPERASEIGVQGIENLLGLDVGFRGLVRKEVGSE